MSAEITAKPIEWEDYRNREWSESRYGFSIHIEDDEDPAYRYSAFWGDDHCDHFETLDEAKAHCQYEIDNWVRSIAVVPQLSEVANERDALRAEVERLREREQDADWLIINATLLIRAAWGKDSDWMLRRSAWGDQIAPPSDTNDGEGEG